MTKKKLNIWGRMRRRWRQAKWTFIIIATVLAANFLVQVARKPTEALGFVFSQKKTMYDTWSSYKNEFLSSETDLIPAEFLAAVAQVESAGDPVAQPKWVLRFTTDILNIYSPASSAVGLMQITEGNYHEAKTLCIKQKKVSRDCWLNKVYARVLPSHSIEMASAYMHQTVTQLLGDKRAHQILRDNIYKLAAVIHLCGKQKAYEYVQSNFKLNSFSRCGSHSVSNYIRKVFAYKTQFARFVDEEMLAGKRDLSL